MTTIGFDYAWGRPGVSALKGAGAKFVMRYLSWLPNGKVINKSELDALRAGGIAVGLNWEFAAGDMKGGFSSGTIHGKEALRQAKALGYPKGLAIYFSADWDATPAQQTLIHSYVDGVRLAFGGYYKVGLYGGYYPVKRALDAGHVDYGWQTYAWSGGQWDQRAAIRQVKNGLTLNGVSVDRDELIHAPAGLWWPGATPEPTTPPPSTTERKVTPMLGLRKGDTGTEVKLLQVMLHHSGFSPEPGTPDHGIDGIYGTMTASAVLRMRKSLGSTATSGDVITTDAYEQLFRAHALNNAAPPVAGPKGDPGPAGPKGDPGDAAVLPEGAVLKVVQE